MRKTLYYILMIMLVAAQTVSAAPAKKKSNKKTGSTKEWKGANRNLHHIAFWGGAGYSGLLNNSTYSRFNGGGGGLLGVGYEYRYDHFILNAGPEFRIFSSMDKISFPYPYDVAMMADGYNQIKHYTFGDPMRENHVAGQVMLPVLLGGQWDQWYFMAGVKVGYTVLGTYSQRGTLTTSITDLSAFDPNWTDMPSHDIITDAPYRTKGTYNYGLDLTASAEVGVYINGFMGAEWNKRNKARKYPLHLRAALFMDYGVMNLAKGAQGPIATADENTITTRSLHSSDWASQRINSLLIGVKVTALLQMNKPQPPKPQKPAMVLRIADSRTNKAIPSVAVEMTALGNPKAKPIRKTANSKGVMVAKVAAGGYRLQLRHADYIPLEHEYSHGEWGDTLELAMMPRPEFRCFVRDAKSDSLLASAITFVNTADEKAVASANTNEQTGAAQLRLPLNTSLRIHIEAANHFALTAPLESIEGEYTYYLEPIVKKRVIILHNLFFATNETTILPESMPAMQDLYDLMNENPEIRIRITGHTDNVGSDEANQKLSEGRANSVRDDLIRRGIAPERIEAEGKGESQPITTNDTEEGRAQNRRVEFVIL